MSSAHESSPRLEREAKDSMSSDYVPMYVCARCDEEFRLDPKRGRDERICPACGSTDTSEDVHRVYA